MIHFLNYSLGRVSLYFKPDLDTLNSLHIMCFILVRGAYEEIFGNICFEVRKKTCNHWYEIRLNRSSGW